MLYALFLYVNAHKGFMPRGARCKNYIKLDMTDGVHSVKYALFENAEEAEPDGTSIAN